MAFKTPICFIPSTSLPFGLNFSSCKKIVFFKKEASKNTIVYAPKLAIKEETASLLY